MSADLPLLVAIRNDDTEGMKKLLDEGADVNASDKFGDTPLHVAVNYGKNVAVKILLSKGADGEKKNTDGQTPLQIVWEKWDDWTAVYYSKNLNPGRPTPLHAAAAYGEHILAMLLINKGASVNAQDASGKTPLFYAAGEDLTAMFIPPLTPQRKKCELVECLLDHGADVNARDKFGRTALHAGVSADHKSQGLSPFSVLQNWVEHPVFFDNRQPDVPGCIWSITRSLLERGAQVNAKTADGTTALHVAAGEGCKSAIETLLEFHADIYARNAQGDTPLDIAVRSCGNAEAVEILLKLEGGANAKDKNGKFYFHVAAKKSSSDVVEMFLKCGASVNCQDDAKKTALHYAAEEGLRETVRILLGYGAYIDCRDELDETPLHKAASYQGYFSTVEILLTSGADVNALCSSNETALDKTKKSSSNIDARLALKNYIVLRASANLFVRPQDLLTVGDYAKFNGLWSDYKTEVEKLMTEKIDNVSCYDLLTSNSSKLAKYMKNEAINQAFESGEFTRKFPFYANILKCKFRRGKERAGLLRYDHKTSGILSDIFPELPSLCTDVIMNYLSNDDLKILIGLEKLDLILQD